IGTTDATGHLVTPRLPLAEYTCTETHAPAPYLLNTEKQAFEIKKLDTTVALEFTNTLAMDNLNIKKTGQDRDHWNLVEEKGEAVIHYETKDIAGAVFNVVAKEDIVTAEGIIRARKGDIVAKMTTDDKGEAHVT
ncbi:MSCRAMM family protein, partial [Eubacterium aggregans]